MNSSGMYLVEEYQEKNVMGEEEEVECVEWVMRETKESQESVVE